MKTFACLVLLACVSVSEGRTFLGYSRPNCRGSVLSEMSPGAALGPGGTQSRRRPSFRSPRYDDAPCLSPTENVSITDPWAREAVPQKFHNNFMTGHYYRFLSNGSRRVGLAGHVDNLQEARVQGGDDGGVTLLPRDLLFMIDMSGSISRSDWTMMKRKLAELIERLCGTIGRRPQHNRIAVMTFSRQVVLNFNFRTHWTIRRVKDAIMRMPQARGSTCTGDALDYAHRYMFDPDTGIRSATQSVKEVLVITDGRSNCGAAVPNAARRLQVKAFVFVLAIGNFGTSGRAEVESLVSHPLLDHIFSLANFFDFRNMVNAILEYPDKCAPFELK